MRIGIDATALPPRLVGAGNYIVNLIRALLQLDAKNEYVVFVKPEQRFLFEPREHLELVNAALSSPLVRVAWEQTALPLLARQYRLDLLHSPHYTVPLLVRSKTVATFHDMTFFLYPELHEAYKRLYFKPIIRLSARRANAIIADSESTRQDILKILRVNPQQIVAVPLGVSDHPRMDNPLEIARVRRQYNLPEKFILNVGVLEPRKNVTTLVRAFKSLIEQGIPHSLAIVGKRGWHYEQIFQTVKDLGIEDRVIFTDYIPENDLRCLYRASDLFVYPSFYEGFGLPVLEAMAQGVPVVTSNLSSMPEIAGDTALRVNPHDEPALASAMQRVLTDRGLHDKLAQDGYARSKLFSWRRTARETLGVYERVFQAQ